MASDALMEEFLEEGGEFPEDLLFQNTSKKVMQAPEGKADRDYRSIDKLVVSADDDSFTSGQYGIGTHSATATWNMVWVTQP